MMKLLLSLLGFLLLFEQRGAVSFGLYDIKRSLTPFGWALVILLLLSLTYGIIYLGAKIINKSKLK